MSAGAVCAADLRSGAVRGGAGSGERRPARRRHGSLVHAALRDRGHAAVTRRLAGRGRDRPGEPPGHRPRGYEAPRAGRAAAGGGARDGEHGRRGRAGARGRGLDRHPRDRPRLRNVSSQVVGARLVLASGEVLALDAQRDPERLAAARVSPWVFSACSRSCGCSSSRRIACTSGSGRPASRSVSPSSSATSPRPATTSSGGTRTRTTRSGRRWRRRRPRPSPSRGRKGERIDWSARVLPSVRELKFNEMEYSVPAAAGPACFRAVRERMRSRWPDVVWPVEYRTLAGDDAWLSTAHARDTVTISLHQDAKLRCRSVLRRLRGDLHGARRAPALGQAAHSQRARPGGALPAVGALPSAAPRARSARHLRERLSARAVRDRLTSRPH